MSLKSEYLTKAIAAERLGISPRRLLEISQRGDIRRHHVRDIVTKRRQTVFRAGDVERIRDEIRSRKSALIPTSGFARELAALPPVRTEIPQYRWLTLAESAEYTHLPASYLLKLIETKELSARDVGRRTGGRWRISRRALDAIE